MFLVISYLTHKSNIVKAQELKTILSSVVHNYLSNLISILQNL